MFASDFATVHELFPMTEAGMHHVTSLIITIPVDCCVWHPCIALFPCIVS
jgi:hypothetical protein